MFEPLSRREIFSLCVSLLCGFALGIEREYHNKSTGIRTLVLICLGSTLFTLISHHSAGSDDRIAANIITGIGFIGAGVIFKDRLAVLGLTTAAVIWATAAIGMAAGAGAHSLALTCTGGVLATLMILHPVENWVNSLPQSRVVTVTFKEDARGTTQVIEELAQRYKLRSKIIQLSKKDCCTIAVVKLHGLPADMHQLNEALLGMDAVKEFS